MRGVVKVGVGVLALLALAVIALMLRPEPSRVTQANYERIKPGMSKAEVYAILGPPVDLMTDRTIDLLTINPDPTISTESWKTDAFIVVVHFRASDTVWHKDSFVPWTNGTFLDKLRRTLKQHWHDWFGSTSQQPGSSPKLAGVGARYGSGPS
jgi:hypothetical protein